MYYDKYNKTLDSGLCATTTPCDNSLSGAVIRVLVPVINLRRNQALINENACKNNVGTLTGPVPCDPTWHSLLQYHRLEQPAHTNSDFFMPQPWQSGVFFTSAAAGASAPPLPEQRQLSGGS